MKNLMARETGVSSSSGLNGAFLAVDMATEFLGRGHEHWPRCRGKCIPLTISAILRVLRLVDVEWGLIFLCTKVLVINFRYLLVQQKVWLQLALAYYGQAEKPEPLRL
jgi:hypothetical protein